VCLRASEGVAFTVPGGRWCSRERGSLPWNYDGRWARSGIMSSQLLMLLGGDLHIFITYRRKRLIIILAGRSPLTMIRFPLGVMLHGLPLGRNCLREPAVGA